MHTLFQSIAKFWAAITAVPLPVMPILTDAEEMSVLSSLLYCSGN
jgi:hypothetical protein